jgi:hypothetical protein
MPGKLRESAQERRLVAAKRELIALVASYT